MIFQYLPEMANFISIKTVIKKKTKLLIMLINLLKNSVLTKISVVIIVTLNILSCNSKSAKLKELLKPATAQRENKFEVYCADTIIINVPVNKFSSYTQTSIYNDSLLYCVHFSKPLTIDIYDIVNKNISNEIKVPEYAVATKRVGDLCVHKPDSIFFLESHPVAINLIDTIGRMINKYDAKNGMDETDISSKRPLEFIFPTFLSYRDPIYLPNRKELVLLTHPVDSEISTGYEEINRIGIFNLEKNKLDRFMAKPEGVFKERGNLCFNYDLSLPYFIEVDSILYVTYPIDHYIYAYDINSGKLLFKSPGNSKIPEKLEPPVRRSRINDTQYAWNYRIQIPFYGPLFYNKKLKMFTRNFHFRQDLKLNNGKLNDGSRRKGSVIILDSTLKIVGETFFENGELGVLKCLPMSDGFLMAPNSFKQESDDILAYKYKYEIRKIDDK